MIEKIITILAGFIIGTISRLGYGGVVLLMAIESACIPLPSEIIMPFSGYLVSTGEMNLWLVGLAGALSALETAGFRFTPSRPETRSGPPCTPRQTTWYGHHDS